MSQTDNCQMKTPTNWADTLARLVERFGRGGPADRTRAANTLRRAGDKGLGPVAQALLASEFSPADLTLAQYREVAAAARTLFAALGQPVPAEWTDWLREVAVRVCRDGKLSGDALAARVAEAGGELSPRHAYDFLARRAVLRSAQLGVVFEVLGIDAHEKPVTGKT